MESYVYRSDVLAALQQYGIRPTAETPPAMARGFVRDLYCYEIRTLRDRMLRQEFPKQEYAGRVVALRDRYRVLSLRASQWVTATASEPGTTGDDEPIDHDLPTKDHGEWETDS